jgi:pimeloyl-ACP methyl ester carboxylesterase
MSQHGSINVAERDSDDAYDHRDVTAITHHYIEVEGARTHYLEAGEGDPLVLLHSGEFGASAELSWAPILPLLAAHHRTIAPDWLGYGETDKLHDFGGGAARRVRHMAAFVDALGITGAAFAGNSMGGSVLARVAATEQPAWPITAAILISGGGFAPHNHERQALLDYDGTPEAMRRMMRVLFHDPAPFLGDDYIARRVESSNRPGAWEAVAAARFKSPQVAPRSDFGQPDATPYERIRVPTLLIAGADDRLRAPGYADAIAGRIPSCTLRVFDRCGHVPNLEQPERTARCILEFLDTNGGEE